MASVGASTPPETVSVSRAVLPVSATGPVAVTYEAGPTGYALQRQLLYERERGLMAAGAASGMLPGSLAASQHLQQQQRHHEEYLRYSKHDFISGYFIFYHSTPHNFFFIIVLFMFS